MQYILVSCGWMQTSERLKTKLLLQRYISIQNYLLYRFKRVCSSLRLSVWDLSMYFSICYFRYIFTRFCTTTCFTLRANPMLNGLIGSLSRSIHLTVMWKKMNVFKLFDNNCRVVVFRHTKRMWKICIDVLNHFSQKSFYESKPLYENTV